MLHHYLTLAFRNLWRKKIHAAINIVGLATGVSACLIIYLIVTFELSYNKDIPGYNNIYRIHSQFSGSFAGLNRGVPTATAPYIRENFKGIEGTALFFCFGSKVQIPTADELKNFDQQKTVCLADSSYFTVFDFYSTLAGSLNGLSKPYSVVLTKSQGKKYFGDISFETMLGKEIIYRDSLKTNVVAIVDDPHFKTDLEFTDFVSAVTLESSWIKKNFSLNDWSSTNSSTQVFIKTQESLSQADVLAQLPLLAKEYNEKNDWAKNDFNAQPLSDLHFNPETGIFDFSRDAAHRPTLITLSFVAILLLIIGAINFINLETAQAAKRAKEVGVRKVLGSARSRLILQFLCESILLTAISLLIALPMAEGGLIFFDEFVPKGVELNLLQIAPFLGGILLFVGVFAGAYPAFVLSSFLPVQALKNATYDSGNSRASFLRKSLIVFQFTFAQVLILVTLVIGWQIRYVLTKDLGFKREAVIYFDTPWYDKNDKTQLLKNELTSLSEISDVSLSDSPPSANGWSSQSVKYKGEEEIKFDAFRKFGDTHYLEFYNIQLLAGRNLLPSDTVKELIINETMMREMGIESPEKAIGQSIEMGGLLPIVGVVKDFHTRSLRKKIDPVMMANEEKNFSCVNVKIAPTKEGIQPSIDKIKQAWTKIYPDVPFNYEFLDETIQNFYRTERRTSKLANTATAMAIFISCLGLFGLASFTTIQRAKEIGIRKILGATVNQLTFLLTKEFLLFVLIAFILASPVAWYASNQWLADYTYRTEVSSWMFICTGIAAAIIAFITVSFQTIKAANRNPVNSLRSE
jgi:putative ABC transport system permease protein